MLRQEGMNLSAIKALIEAMARSGLAEMTCSEDGWTLRLVRGSAHAGAGPALPAPIVVPPNTPPVLEEPPARSNSLEAPLGGVVYFRATPDAPPFVEAGSKVQAGDPLCVIEAMKVFNTIRAERDGIVAEILVAPGSEVEAGQPLLRLT
jgi:acetyl-CoA carboxylase biotin carboxyl carrier protein